MSFEGVVECEKPRKVSCVRYEGCPDYFMLVFLIIYYVFPFLLPFLDSVTLSVVVILTLSSLIIA